MSASFDSWLMQRVGPTKYALLKNGLITENYEEDPVAIKDLQLKTRPFQIAYSCSSKYPSWYSSIRGIGNVNSPIYQCWADMKGRCQNPRHKKYPLYGGRGITICDDWQDFAHFYADMGNRPEGKSLDRIDNQGNYEVSNCRWATPKQQSNNQRRNRLIDADQMVAELI